MLLVSVPAGRKVRKENAGHADRWAMRLPGTNFWKGAHFAREGESKALRGTEAKLVSHIISEFAHAVDRSEDSKAHSLGEHLEKEYVEVSFDSRTWSSARGNSL